MRFSCEISALKEHHWIANNSRLRHGCVCNNPPHMQQSPHDGPVSRVWLKCVPNIHISYCFLDASCCHDVCDILVCGRSAVAARAPREARPRRKSTRECTDGKYLGKCFPQPSLEALGLAINCESRPNVAWHCMLLCRKVLALPSAEKCSPGCLIPPAMFDASPANNTRHRGERKRCLSQRVRSRRL